jgi:hypothetical protein
MPPPGRLVVRRPAGGWRDRLRKYQIDLDGHVVGFVERGGAFVLDVAPGRYGVRASLDWGQSPVLPVDVYPGQVVVLKVEPGGSAFSAVFQLLGRPGAYLRLGWDDGAG